MSGVGIDVHSARPAGVARAVERLPDVDEPADYFGSLR